MAVIYFSKAVVSSALGSAALVSRVGQQSVIQGKENRNFPPRLLEGLFPPGNCHRN